MNILNLNLSGMIRTPECIALFFGLLWVVSTIFLIVRINQVIKLKKIIKILKELR